MENYRNRLLMIGFQPDAAEEVIRDLPDAEELETYVLWQEKIYGDQCAKFLDEVMD